MILQLVKYYKSVYRRIRVTSTIKLPTELKTLAASPKPLSVPTNQHVHVLASLVLLLMHTTGLVVLGIVKITGLDLSRLQMLDIIGVRRVCTLESSRFCTIFAQVYRIVKQSFANVCFMLTHCVFSCAITSDGCICAPLSHSIISLSEVCVTCNYVHAQCYLLRLISFSVLHITIICMNLDIFILLLQSYTGISSFDLS